MNIHRNGQTVASPANKRNFFNCDQCEYITQNKFSLKTHQEAKHEGRVFKC